MWFRRKPKIDEEVEEDLPESTDPVTVAIRLTRQVKGLRKDVGHLRHYGIVNRVLVVLDIALSIAVTAALVQVRATNTTAHQNSVVLANLCISGNNFRASDLQRWLIIASAPKVTKLSPAQQAASDKEVAELLDYIRAVDAPRDCHHPNVVTPPVPLPAFITNPSSITAGTSP